MGGKSTYIRQVAICVLLAHVGSFVPAEEANLCIVDSIITRVGASDMQIKGVSTFMAEMLETSCMLKTATSNSLLVIDELGRGTSTSEGYGIARGVAEYITNSIGCFCLFATHFYEITNMEESFAKVKNYHVHAEMIGGKISMLYKLEQGAVSKSYGIFVMMSTGFPEALINEAKERIDILEHRNNEVNSKRVSCHNTISGLKDPSKRDENKMELENINHQNLKGLLSEYSKNLS